MSQPEKIDLICPKCAASHEVLWFRSEGTVIRVTGSTGRPSNKYFGKAERVEGTCKCGYKFKTKDLDEF